MKHVTLPVIAAAIVLSGTACSNGGSETSLAPVVTPLVRPDSTMTAAASVSRAVTQSTQSTQTVSTVYVSTHSLNTVLEFVAGATTPSKTLTGLNNPAGVAVDANGTVYVANTGTDVENVGTATVSEFLAGATTPSKTLTGLTAPHSLAVDANGNVYVLSGFEGASTVVEFVAGATTPSKTFTGLTWPSAVAVDASGTLYVAGNLYSPSSLTSANTGMITEFPSGSTKPSKSSTT